MVFNSVEFLIFYPIVLLLYFSLPKKAKWIMLLGASYFFYLSWKGDHTFLDTVKLLMLIVFTTIVSYVSGIIISRTESKSTKKICLTVTLLVCFGILFFYKYFNFLSASVTSAMRFFGADTRDYSLDLILPVGISFYTFQTLSYVIDVYRGTTTVEKNLGYYALYVSFFPQLVAGPIERPENLLPQLKTPHKLTWENARGGLHKILIGFFKKVVVADLFASYVVNVYNDVENANGLMVLIATVLFAFQIYCDFSGYTDIAIGCAEVMGIRLMQNFDRPYYAKTIKEFWARWHISLSAWFKDYLYIPLGGNRCSKFRNCLNIMIVFLVSGLWHGAAWTYVIWGALHGLYQVIGKFTYKPRNRIWEKIGVSPDGKFVSALRRFNTFILVCFAWIFFRANSTSDVWIIIRKLFTSWTFSIGFLTDSINAMGLDLTGILTCILSLALLSVIDRRKLELRNNTAPVNIRFGYVVWAVALAWVLLLAGDGASSFIYFQF